MTVRLIPVRDPADHVAAEESTQGAEGVRHAENSSREIGCDVQAVPQVTGSHSAVDGQSDREDGHGRNAIASMISLGDHQ